MGGATPAKHSKQRPSDVCKDCCSGHHLSRSCTGMPRMASSTPGADGQNMLQPNHKRCNNGDKRLRTSWPAQAPQGGRYEQADAP
jgi:hypothetical protein